ncbi:unnamed protein product [Musa banksii]
MSGHELGMIKFLFDGAWRSDGRKVLKFHLGRTDAECKTCYFNVSEKVKAVLLEVMRFLIKPFKEACLNGIPINPRISWSISSENFRILVKFKQSRFANKIDILIANVDIVLPEAFLFSGHSCMFTLLVCGKKKKKKKQLHGEGKSQSLEGGGHGRGDVQDGNDRPLSGGLAKGDVYSLGWFR